MVSTCGNSAMAGGSARGRLTNHRGRTLVATGFVFHEIYMWHNTGNFAGPVPFGFPVQPYEHAENPETKRRFRNLLEASGLLGRLKLIEARPATGARH